MSTSTNNATPKNRILAAVTSAPREKSFTCPRTGIDLVARLPTRADRRDASADAAAQWGDRAVKTADDLAERTSVKREHLLARCILCDGSPIGFETVSALDEATLAVYDQSLVQIEQTADPDSDEWTQEDVDSVIEGLKKKDPRIEASLINSGGATLLHLLRTMADRLGSVPTPKSSSDTCG